MNFAALTFERFAIDIVLQVDLHIADMPLLADQGLQRMDRNVDRAHERRHDGGLMATLTTPELNLPVGKGNGERIAHFDAGQFRHALIDDGDIAGRDIEPCALFELEALMPGSIGKMTRRAFPGRSRSCPCRSRESAGLIHD